MDLKELWSAALLHHASTKQQARPGRHAVGRALRAKARISKRRAKRKAA